MNELYLSRPSDDTDVGMTAEDELTEQLSALGMHVSTGVADDADEDDVVAPVEAMPAIEVEEVDPLLAAEVEKENKRNEEEVVDELTALEEMAEAYRKDDSLIIGNEDEI